mgnify:CR=1 FL=1
MDIPARVELCKYCITRDHERISEEKKERKRNIRISLTICKSDIKVKEILSVRLIAQNYGDTYFRNRLPGFSGNLY